MLLLLIMVLAPLTVLPAAAAGNPIVISGANGNATQIEKGTSMKLVASGVTPGKSVNWTVTDLDGGATDAAAVVPISPLSCILTASANQGGSIKITAAQSDGSGHKGEQIIRITSSLMTVDNPDLAIRYVSAGSGEAWAPSANAGYYQGTGISVIPPEDDRYSASVPAYAEYTFTGTGIQWIGEANYSGGVAEVYLDGMKASTVDPFMAPSAIQQYINFSREGLPYGTHTIRVVATGVKNPSSTVYPGTKVLIDAFRVVPDTGTPAVSLRGSERVLAGEAFDVLLNLINLSQAIHAEDITLSYDTTRFEYIDAEAASSRIIIAKKEAHASGTIHILAANDGGVIGEAPILKIYFKAKQTAGSGAGSIAVTEAKLGSGPEGAVLQAGLGSITITVGAEQGDINGDGIISVGDLALAVYSYGKTSDSADWPSVKAADVNHDGRIDITDLVSIAVQMSDE